MTTPNARRPGRPPSAQSRLAVLEAALAVLAENGSGAVTVEAIAVRARVSKATIYRHWSGKEAICREAVAALEPQHAPRCQHMDPGAALEACAAGLASALSATQRGHHVAAIAAAAAGDPALARIWEDAVLAPHHDAIAGVVRHAQQRGTVDASIDPMIVADLVVQPLLGRLHARRLEGLADYARRVAATVWTGLARS